MKTGVNLSIDVTKIDKSKLFKGQKGTYLSAQVFVSDAVDQYGNNGMIVQAVTKEEREQGIQGAILGNCKIFWTDNQSSTSQAPVKQPQNQQAATPDFNDFDDDIPFTKFMKNNEYLI
jgi:hypothetical protein